MKFTTYLNDATVKCLSFCLKAAEFSAVDVIFCQMLDGVSAQQAVCKGSQSSRAS